MYFHSVYGRCNVALNQRGAGGLFVRVKLLSRTGPCPHYPDELVVGWRALRKLN